MVGPGGFLYVVATPIGNLEDITLRASRILRSVACVAAEDTRRTATLLHHLGASPRLMSYREENHARATRAVCEQLARGESVALVSDAGTPAISDPGVGLVREAVARGFGVVPVPGACAAVAALAAAGIPCGSFRFVGFLARSGKRRRLELAQIAESDDATVIYESPHRIGVTLADLAAACGETRPAALGRELTKLHEEWLRGTLASVAALVGERSAMRGEIVLVVGARDAGEESRSQNGADTDRAASESAIETAAEEPANASTRDLISALARELGLPRRTVYQIAMRLKQSE